MFVTIAMYALVTLIYMHFTGNWKASKAMINVFMGIAMIGSIVSVMAIGAPLYIYPFALLFGFSSVNLYFKRKAIFFLLVLLSCTVILSWHLISNFFFISFVFATGIQLNTFIIFLIVMFVFTFLLVGTIIVNDSVPLNQFLLVVYSFLFSFFEQILFSSMENNQGIFILFLFLFCFYFYLIYFCFYFYFLFFIFIFIYFIFCSFFYLFVFYFFL